MSLKNLIEVMAKATQEIWNIDGLKIPVFIYREKRFNNRISITKKGVNLRIPKFGANLISGSYRSWAEKWLIQQLERRPDIVARFKSSQYVTGYEIVTPYKTYTLDISRSERSTSTAKLKGAIIVVNLNQTLSEFESAKTIRALISRVIGKDQIDRVTDRILAINDHYFKQEIKGVKIKNNSSNWGSCSTSGNINISSRTLLAPFEVQDYIFVHELSHRLEMNHSPKYWSIVKKVMPSYEHHEKWIKENGHLCEI